MTRFLLRTVAVLLIGSVAVVGALSAFQWITASASAPSMPKAVACPAAAPVKVGTISVPAGPVAGFCQDRLVNAAHIINAAHALGIGQHTQAI
jgi:hypothetical protein